MTSPEDQKPEPIGFNISTGEPMHFEIQIPIESIRREQLKLENDRIHGVVYAEEYIPDKCQE